MSTISLFTACYPPVDTHEHTYESTWTYNSTHHWFACEYDSCTDTKQKSEHIFVDGSCAVCGLTISSANTGSNDENNNSSNNTTDNNLNNSGSSSTNNNNNNNNNNNSNNNSNNSNNIQTTACTYKVVSAPMNNGMIVIDSFTAENVNYYYVDLGYAENVPVWSGAALHYNQNQVTSPSLSFSKEMLTESAVESSISNTISKTLSQSFATSQSVQIGIEAGSEQFKASASYQNSRTWGTGTENQNSTTSALSRTQKVADAYGLSGTFYPGGCGYGYYRLSILATCDIYALVKTNASNSEVLGITYAFCPRENAALVIEFSQDSTWTDSTSNKINITQSAINRLPSPKTTYDEYLSESYSTSAAPSTAQSGENTTTVVEHSGETAFTISVPSELKRFMDMGWLYVKVTATCNANLKYRSNEHTATATVKASFNDKGYTEIASFEAVGGGWPWSYVNPAYGDEVASSSTLNESFSVTADSMFITMNYYYLISFDEYKKDFGGGTHAVTYQFNMNQIQYEFYIDDSK